ncbi:O-antigen ligase domain-containing protein [Roseiconus nitratireducens]|uniref:O-antigen ligase domain-containing protein n=1 Tax=Roseiconus nitratireducens TaxID=2605748 RepID=A0A5M6DEY6_9BACT|nr:O-antigen ligase domain-containing protein [Roseiconus nitratireducens]KAA5546124.1 O-antigen ligase domain-containing protein [Roseiconus nitratireducens]
MSLLVPLAMFGWIPVILCLYAVLRPRLATGIAFAAGWCFLPMAAYELPGLPDYSKMFATSAGALLGLAAFHPATLMRFRFGWIDLPILVWCVCPMFSSLTNGLGAYDGLAATVHQTILWGLPYFIGRTVYRKPEHLVPLAVAVLMCGIVYAPLCLWEARMSPQLHLQVFGFRQHVFGQSVRFGGYRPMVFMQHGLQVALWIASCFVLAFAGWRCGGIRRWRGYPVWPVVIALGVTLVMCRSLGAWTLAFAAVAGLYWVNLRRAVWPLVLLTLLVPGYMFARSTGLFSGRSLVRFVAEVISEDKADSLEFRLENEEMLIAKAWQRPVFGWGGWGRNRVQDDEGNDLSVTDGLWIIVFGTNGLVGLSALYGMLILGPIRMIRRCHPKQLKANPEMAIALGVAVVCVINAIDSLPNAMVIPVFTMATGAVTSASLVRKTKRRTVPGVVQATAETNHVWPHAHSTSQPTR